MEIVLFVDYASRTPRGNLRDLVVYCKQWIKRHGLGNKQHSQQTKNQFRRLRKLTEYLYFSIDYNLFVQ